MSRYAQMHGDDGEQRVLRLGFLADLWPFVRPYRRAFAGCLLILAMSFVLELLGPWILRQAVDGPMSGIAYWTDSASGDLFLLAGAFLLITLASTWLGYISGLWTAWNGQRVVRDVRRHLFRHLMNLSPRFFEQNPAGVLTTRVTTDVENLNELISTGVLQTLFDLLKIAGVIVALFFIDSGLALFTVATTPIVVVISMVFRRHASRSFQRVRGRLAVQNGFTGELVGGIRATRAFGQEQAVLERYRELNNSTKNAWLETVFQFSLFFSLVDGALRLCTIGTLYVGGRTILGGTLQVGEFLQFWLYYGLLIQPLRELGEKYNVLQAAFASTDRILRILAEPRFPPPEASPRPRASWPAQAPLLTFEGVSFSYSERMPVLADISLVAPPGSTVALVGPTGAGKSTLLALLSRLQDPDSGRITVNGIDLRSFDLLALRSAIAVVPQDLFLFTGSVLDNVRQFRTHVPEARVRAALVEVGAWDFVARLPEGLSTTVEERGATFSQGERQLLAFARALVQDPQVLVLDEATASMDSATEQRLQHALVQARTGRTTFIVAHRLSTVRHADQILVLHEGRIAERGRHRELLAADGMYARMVRVGMDPMPPSDG